ncbi:MAG TPA: hypothetical protein VKB38_16025 [Terracidiphilus sp.]|nr:hypothetical protein [Terracidiphilus sp.]
MTKSGNRWVIGGLALLMSLAAALPARSQDKDSFTPMALDAGFGAMNIDPPSTPPDEIIKNFAAKETQFQEALNHYTYRRVARVQTIDDDTSKVDGEWYQVDDVIFDPSGKRTEKTVFAPESSLQRVSMSPSDLQDIQHGYPFVLTTAELPNYDIKYVGRQKVDEIECYVFDVSPKQILKNHRYLLGRVWVDTTDLQIVVTDGRMVPDDTRRGSEDLHPPFMTWRQQIDGHYWFPVYTKGEGVLHFAGQHGYPPDDVHIRDTIKYTDYKQFGSTMKIISVDGEASTTPPSAQKPPQKPKQ